MDVIDQLIEDARKRVERETARLFKNARISLGIRAGRAHREIEIIVDGLLNFRLTA